MKNNVIAFVLLFILSSSCKKNEMDSSPLASLSIINAIVNGKNIRLNSYLADSVLTYNSRWFSVVPGNRQLYVFTKSDSLHPYFNAVRELASPGSYSLFLSGDVLGSGVDSMWVKDAFPAYYNDSAVGVRFINLCKSSNPLYFTLASDTINNLVSGVSYKTLTGFVKLPLKTVIPAGSVTFQARSTDGKVKATYTLPANPASVYPKASINLARFKTITIVVKGMDGGTGTSAVGLFPVANFF